jgi:LytS/YehU family sensor histidine kinase
MRYNINEIGSEYISLNTEIDYLEKFIRLHKIRFDGNLYIDCVIKGETKDIEIPPLALISLVENSFKHGRKDDPSNPIKVKIQSCSKKISIEVQNIKDNASTLSTGVGVASLRRRLELSYGESCKYYIVEDGDYYTSRIEIVN